MTILMIGHKLFSANVGDSRAVLIRNNPTNKGKKNFKLKRNWSCLTKQGS